MVEGHQVHRVASQHRKLLLNRCFRARSPNGRFAEGASAIDRKELVRVEAHGKNLFYFFAQNRKAPPEVVHVHFGMAGRFGVYSLDKLPEPTKTTRLELVDEASDLGAHLSAMTVQHGGLDMYERLAGKLGQDPLREDADVSLLWEEVRRYKKSVGLLLMDQARIAGVGNIYRAEILFKAGIHPETPAAALSHEEFLRVWRHSVLLLQRGYETGSILTVDEEGGLFGPPWTRRYVYNQSKCGRCGSRIKSWDIANRTAYACETCQPLKAALPGDRAKVLAGAKDAALFTSHCAPDGAEELCPAKMKVAQLRQALEEAGLPTAGKKAELVARLEGHRGAGAEEPKGPEGGAPVPGTRGLAMASAEEAVVEKQRARESRAVEHVALDDDQAAAAVAAARPRKRRAGDKGAPGGSRAARTIPGALRQRRTRA